MGQGLANRVMFKGTCLLKACIFCMSPQHDYFPHDVSLTMTSLSQNIRETWRCGKVIYYGDTEVYICRKYACINSWYVLIILCHHPL